MNNSQIFTIFVENKILYKHTVENLKKSINIISYMIIFIWNCTNF